MASRSSALVEKVAIAWITEHITRRKPISHRAREERLGDFVVGQRAIGIVRLGFTTSIAGHFLERNEHPSPGDYASLGTDDP